MLTPGSMIAEKYRIERLLGQGGMGAVYVATNMVLQKQVALKVMTGAFAADATAIERFFREAMSASRVRHPGIVEIYDAGRTHEGAPWMAMALLDGESLGERLHRMGRLPLGEIVPLFSPVLSALGAVHAQGIVHRDLKPDNIFLERLPDGSIQPKLLDFGIAKRADGLDKLTRTGTVMGTAHYLAPEQARDSSLVDPRTDLYAIGVVLYEALSGRFPHEGVTIPELVLKLVSEDPTPLLAVAPDVPAAVANVVHWCLSRELDARPQKAADLDHHLRASLTDVPMSVSATPVDKAAAAGRLITGTADSGAPHAFAAAGMSPTRSAPPVSGAPVPRPVGPTEHMSASAPGVPHAYQAPHPSQPSFVPVASPTSSGSSRWLLWGVVATALLGGCVVFGLPIAMMVLGVATSAGIASGAGGDLIPSMSFPQQWQSWRAPFFVDVDGDGHEDLIGWSNQIIGSENHQLLCAFDGQDGHEIWRVDVGDQDDIGDTETVLIGDRVIYFDATGRASAYRVRDGESFHWNSSVNGEPEEICVLGTDRLMVRTDDDLWNQLTLATGHTALAGAAAVPGCAPARVATPPRGIDIRTSVGTWRALTGRDRPRGVDLFIGSGRRAYGSADGQRILIVGAPDGAGRNPAELVMRVNDTEVWREVVPIDPLRAQATLPEAVAITDEAIFAAYEMTPRGDFPRRAAAFRTADGTRLWDVGLREATDRETWYLLAGRETLVLSVNTILIVLDRQTGEERYRIGEPPRRR